MVSITLVGVTACAAQRALNAASVSALRTAPMWSKWPAGEAPPSVGSTGSSGGGGRLGMRSSQKERAARYSAEVERPAPPSVPQRLTQ